MFNYEIKSNFEYDKEIVSLLNTCSGVLKIASDDLDEDLKRIWSHITTCIEPNPESEIKMEVQFEEGKAFIVLHRLGLTYNQLKIYLSESHCSFKMDDVLKKLLADQNDYSILFIKFDQVTDYGHVCLLTSFIRIIDRFIAENICFSDTTVRPRIDCYLFNLDYVRQALLNAFIYNDWTVGTPVIRMNDNCIEIEANGSTRNDVLLELFLETKIIDHYLEVKSDSLKYTIPFKI